MILKKIQESLEDIYQIHLKHNVEDFLTPSIQDIPQALKIGQRFRQEALIIKSAPEHIELALFVEAEYLKLLREKNPFVKLEEDNLNSFLIATEGVSHFIYFVNRTEENKPVTQLELELQAEVDKYLLTCFVFRQQRGRVPAFLLIRLFENFNWDDSLDETQIIRYQEANRFAAKLCSYWDQHYLRSGQWEKTLKDARYFYCLNHWDKIRKLTP